MFARFLKIQMPMKRCRLFVAGLLLFTLGATAQQLQFSQQHGFCKEPFTLLIANAEGLPALPEGATIRYTLDGSEPTASNGTRVADGSTITITSDATLKAGLLIGNTVSGVITRNYIVDNDTFEPYEITVYLKDPTVAPNNWALVNFYTWDSDNYQFNGGWPGETITETQVINGTKFYCKNYTIKARDYYMNFVFNQGPSNKQTVDVTDVNKTSFFEVTTQTNKYLVKDVTDIYLPYLVGVEGDVSPDAGDVNDDGEVNIADVSAVIDIILRS